MEVVTGATSSLLPKLGALLQEEYNLQKNVKRDVESLQKELTFMRAALCKVAEVPPEQLDEQVKAWASNIKELSYHMEDAIDTFKVRVEGNGPSDPNSVAINLISMFRKANTRHQLADVVKDMKGLTKEVAELRDRYLLDNSVTKPVHQINVSTIYELLAWWARCDIASILDNLKVWVAQQLCRRHIENTEHTQDSYGDGASTESENQQRIRRLFGMEEPVAVDNEMVKLGKWVTDEENQNCVLYIVGSEGVGKTTIGTALYRKFGGRFDCRAMVKVPESSDLESAETVISIVLGSILNQVIPPPEQQGVDAAPAKKTRNAAFVSKLAAHLKPKNRKPRGGGTVDRTNMSNQQNNVCMLLKDFFQKHSCLLLIDDVRSEKTLEQIRDLLPPTDKRCRIVVTTRFPAVATACKAESGDYTHQVNVLGERRCRELFLEALSESIDTKGIEGKHMRNIPPRIWEMCSGQPMPIVIMAGHVACNPHKSAEEWNQVCNKLVPVPTKALTQDGILRIISHCYNDLPAEIKTCSLYLAMYPKSCKIRRKHLIRRWIGEGFVREKWGMSLEYVAETYFNHLIMRKIIQPIEHSSNGMVKNCGVYDMVHEFIVSKAFEENFVIVAGGYWSTPPPSSKVRRLSVQGNDSRCENAMKTMNLLNVRSLSMFEKQLPSNSFDSPLVQVLDLEGCNDFQKHMHIPKAICKMLLLTYLSFRRTDIVELPKEIGNLRNLRTLDIRDTNVAKLPNSVCQLKRLVDILGGSKQTRKALKLPEDMKKMASLCVLSGIEIIEEQTAVADFQQLTNLRKLAIYKLNIKKESKLSHLLMSSIKSLGGSSLQTLVINEECSSEFLKSLGCSSFHPKFLNSLELTGMLVELPEWLGKLEALTKLTLPVTTIRTDNLQLLSHMRILFSLTFSATAAKQDKEIDMILNENKATSDGEILVPTGGFENLKLLRFSTPVVPPLSFPEKAMPNLERLELCFTILEGIYGIENLNILKEVRVRVNGKSDEFTNWIIDDMVDAARRDDKRARVILDRYYHE